MATFAQIVGGQALNVINGIDLQAALAQHFAPGFDGGHPGVEWRDVPDGTESGWSVTIDGSGAVTGYDAPPQSSAPAPKWDVFTFTRRFTQAERIAMRNLAKESDAAADFLDLLDKAGMTGKLVYADDPDVVAAISAFETATILTHDRALAILGS